MNANHLKIGQLQQLQLRPVTTTGQTGAQHVHRTSTLTGQTGDRDRSDRWPRPVRPVHNRAQKWLETTWKSSKCIQQAISSSNLSPLLTMHESNKNAKLSTYKNITKDAIHVQISKLDTL
jgi:hypothetical protein